MSLTKNLAAYGHVQQILDAALLHPITKYETTSKSQAMRFRADAYYFRRLLSDQGDNRYLQLILRVEDRFVVIERRAPVGVLISHDGTEIAPGTPRALTKHEDELEAAAFALSKSLGLDVDDL